MRYDFRILCYLGVQKSCKMKSFLGGFLKSIQRDYWVRDIWAISVHFTLAQPHQWNEFETSNVNINVNLWTKRCNQKSGCFRPNTINVWDPCNGGDDRSVYERQRHLNLVIDGWSISCKNAPGWTSPDQTADKSTLVQVMAWCRQASSHYLNQCWLRSMPPYCITSPQWVNAYNHTECQMKFRYKTKNMKHFCHILGIGYE